MDTPKLNFTIDGAQNMEVRKGAAASFSGKTSGLLNGGDTLTVETEHGDMLFQNVKTPFGALSLSRYNIVHEASVSAQAPDSAIEFIFMMTGNAKFKMEGLKEIEMWQKDCNLIYYPFVNNTVKFPAGTNIMTIDLHLHERYLLELVPYFHNIGRFLEKVHKKEAANMFDLPIAIPSHVLGIISELFTKTSEFKKQELFLKKTILDWISTPFESPIVLHKVKQRLTGPEKDRIIGVYEYMLAYSDSSLSIEDLARKAGMSEFKLKNGFNQIFHSPPHATLILERMKKAVKMLHSPDHSVSDIAYTVGYPDLASFSKAFKKHTGHPPSVFRVANNRDFDDPK